MFPNPDKKRFVHGLEKKAGLIKGSNLDSLVLSGEDGVTWLYFDENRAAWKSVHIGDGEQGYFNISGFIASGGPTPGKGFSITRPLMHVKAYSRNGGYQVNRRLASQWLISTEMGSSTSQPSVIPWSTITRQPSLSSCCLRIRCLSNQPKRVKLWWVCSILIH